MIAITSPLIDNVKDYLSTPMGNGQVALALFIAITFVVFIAAATIRHRGILKDRKNIPFSMGGWGTRGKSGTERIKAGLFQGLGYDVICKTTGCEAMFIHNVDPYRAEEIFIFRPFDKATIWEQANLMSLGSEIHADIFLWECMALNPRYVSILQKNWMRDDIATITNAFPDHEDVQGPSGMDVASTIGQFIPSNSKLFSTELSFSPLFKDICKERNTEHIHITPHTADLISDEVLNLFPYNEHPHNIALVAKVAESLEIDPDLSMLTMADHVIADLGVLKAYPTIRYRSRTLTFINAMSANERTGFLASWKRMGLADHDASLDTEQQIVSVVNNRADRIPRSEVFARILARDIDLDRRVLIGTNLKGLRGYLETAFDEYLEQRPVVTEEWLKEGAIDRAEDRLATYFAKIRLPRAEPQLIVDRIQTWAAGCGLQIDPEAHQELLEWVESQLIGETPIPKNIADYDNYLRPRLITASELEPEHLEVAKPAELSEVSKHLKALMHRSQSRYQLKQNLQKLFNNEYDLSQFTREFNETFKAMFMDTVVIVEDPSTKGDQIIDYATDAVPPGTKVSLVGMQNIKGTGLDFAYRWIAIEQVHKQLVAVKSGAPEAQLEGLQRLLAMENVGALAAGLICAELKSMNEVASTDAETLKTKVIEKMKHQCKFDFSEHKKKGISAFDKFCEAVEGGIDYLDVIRNRSRSKLILNDLVHQRITHTRAAHEMREVVARQKGGWLADDIRTRSKKWSSGIGVFVRKLANRSATDDAR